MADPAHPVPLLNRLDECFFGWKGRVTTRGTNLTLELLLELLLVRVTLGIATHLTPPSTVVGAHEASHGVVVAGDHENLLRLRSVPTEAGANAFLVSPILLSSTYHIIRDIRG